MYEIAETHHRSMRKIRLKNYNFNWMKTNSQQHNNENEISFLTCHAFIDKFSTL